MGIVIDSETYCIYKVVLQTIKVAAHNLFVATQFSQYNTANTERRDITPREGLNQSNLSCLSSRLILHCCDSPDPNLNI
jgi:hypothetical protein